MTSRLICLTAAVAVCLCGAGPRLERSDMWVGGQDGYKMFRIPGIVVTKKGTVLAYAEARRPGGDWATIDIAVRRSTDRGKTFSPPAVIGKLPGPVQRNPVAIERKQGKPTDVTYNNPVAIADRNGTVHFLFCVEYMRVFYMRSTDDGKTFSIPVEITTAFDAFRPEYAWRVVATGPGHGIQLQNGRLVVPVWLSLGTGGNGHSPALTATVYSDDHGTTWRRGAIAVPNTERFPEPNEASAVELADGRVMLNIRTVSPENRRAVAISPDGAARWSEPRFQPDLHDPICMGSIVRYGAKKEARKQLLFSIPDSLARADGKEGRGKDRKNLTIHLSGDSGTTWPVKRVLEAGPSGYSDLAVLPDKTVLCLYESGTGPGSHYSTKIVLARFNLDWVKGSK